MKTILALETSSHQGSAALIYQGQVLTTDLPEGETHSYSLLPMVQHLLEQAKIEIKQVDAIAFDCGPGAFTGVRTACGVAQGLGFALSLPLIPILSLKIQAEMLRQSAGIEECVCVLDARMNEVYWAHYRYLDNQWEAIVEPSLATAEEALAYAMTGGLQLVVGEGVTVSPAASLNLRMTTLPHARAMLSLALNDLNKGLLCEPAMAQPVYLRNKIALTTRERLG